MLPGKLYYFTSLVCLLGVSSCRDTASFTKAEQKIVLGEVQKTLDQYYGDIKTSGLAAEFKYLDSTSGFFWVPPGYSSVLSYDSVRAIIKQNAGKYTSIDTRFEDLKIIPLGYESAAYTGKLRSVTTDTMGKTQTCILLESGILVKRKDGWKLSGGQTTFLELIRDTLPAN